MKVSLVSSTLSTLSHRQLKLMALALSLVLLTLGTPQSQAENRHSPQAEGFAAMEGMDPEEMGKARAREGDAIVNLTTVKSVQNLKASVTDTSFDIGGDMVSGNISFAPDALGSYSGTGIFSAVTGNGNSINNAVGISVFIAN
ncbi:hypothetical protein FHR95_001759 [Halomonas fontilapidosi]|uniref:Uncharacterized protein n=1 Tax=Halomonas fontilapidosi TaxID=616675 RepID=A0A7W5DL73_9GAMM|nr:hypothetical protein [Halomonas fontilapidosi]MBB3184198.1 hypothetical protein [Halomonas fontilapidosi]